MYQMKEEKQIEAQFIKLSQKGVPVLKNREKGKSYAKGGGESTYEWSYTEKIPLQQVEDSPINYSVRYLETRIYNRKHTSQEKLQKENFEMYSDYAETDLDQPTDFSLKYGEEAKESGYDSGQPELDDTRGAYYTEGKPNHGTHYNYFMMDLNIEQEALANGETFLKDDRDDTKKKNERSFVTPLVFSRNSSVESLNSFEAIYQSLLDDRNSVVSDFSRMTSGMISPSELPDSPTQTVPPSPKHFPDTSDNLDCKNVDTKHVNDSKIYNIRTLNVQNAKHNSKRMVNYTRPEVRANSFETKNPKQGIKKNLCHEQIVPDKNKLDEENLELESVSDIEENILADCINIGLQKYSRRHPSKHTKCRDKNKWDTNITQTRVNKYDKQLDGRSGIPSCRSMFQNETKRVYSTYEESDDAVHTYYTEGTPANVSHAGSHLDLSNLSKFTDRLVLSAEDISDDGSYCSGDTENLLALCIQSGMPKAKPWKEKKRHFSENSAINSNRMDRSYNNSHSGRSRVMNPNVCLEHQNCGDFMLTKDVLLMARDEISTFATENSPCNFSIRSSLSDLTFNSFDTPDCNSGCGVQMFRGYATADLTANNIISTSVCSPEKNYKNPEENRKLDVSENLGKKANSCWDNQKTVQTKDSDDFYENEVCILSRNESLSSLSVKSCDSSDLTPLEQALLEQCINSGMPHKTVSKEINSYNDIQDEVDGYPGESLYSNSGGDIWSEDYT